ncbi:MULTISPECIES: hypothetical protein [unclassified Psychrobacter]|uniref:hypothetical protein n=1 Tax=unclassified Psychrobacter TaxID=196806 RepID=UPI0025B3B97E|nr:MULTISPECIES: hypothetical protein [unclassified Psychrobacter]MDN3454677.1 hypothetical protein [Psychrobacter sp. APC 3350]MDN3503680.1 hypothetical protein [Psychrobacter sp. 5A.1]
MPLRPIDAIFVHPKRRLYVVYYRGELWQLPRMKIDDRSWQNRQPYTDDSSSLYLSIHQAINDPVLAQKLRTLNLPEAMRGSTLPRFESWWEAHGFKWLKDKLATGESPLAAHQNKAIDKESTSLPSHQPTPSNKDEAANSKNNNKKKPQAAAEVDIFADMLADLAEEVLHQQI